MLQTLSDWRSCPVGVLPKSQIVIGGGDAGDELTFTTIETLLDPKCSLPPLPLKTKSNALVVVQDENGNKVKFSKNSIVAAKSDTVLKLGILLW